MHLEDYFYYAALLPRRGPHIASHSVCPSVCPSVPLSLPSVTSRHLANYNDTHVLFRTRWGPHIVRPSRPQKLVHYYYYYSCWHPSDYFRLFSRSLGSLLGALTNSFITTRREIFVHVYWRLLYWNAQPGVSATTRYIMPHFVYSLLTFAKCRCYSATVCRTSIKICHL